MATLKNIAAQLWNEKSSWCLKASVATRMEDKTVRRKIKTKNYTTINDGETLNNNSKNFKVFKTTTQININTHTHTHRYICT